MRVLHYYGRTVAGLGLDEDAFVAANSRSSHAWNECLRRLRADGVENRIVLLTAGRGRRARTVDGLDWVFLPAVGAGVPRWPERYLFSPAMLRELDAWRPDLFVFYGNVPTPFAARIAGRLQRARVPFVVTLHATVASLLAPVPGTGPRALTRALARWLRSGEAPRLFGGAAAVIALTDADGEALVRARLAAPERVHVIPSGVAGGWFSPGQAGARGPYPTLAFVGRLEAAKGFDDAVRTFLAARARHPRARLEVAGAWTSPAFRAAIESGLGRAGAGAAVAFHGWLAPAELSALYRRSHLLLFPSHVEGLPRVVIEALACGLPVAAVEGTGGHADLLAGGEAGIVTAREGWTDAVLALLDDPERLARLAAAAAPLARERYSFDAMLERVRALYLGLMRARG